MGPTTRLVPINLCQILQAVGGNIINASPISDLNPTFMAAGTKLNLASKGNSCSLLCSDSQPLPTIPVCPDLSPPTPTHTPDSQRTIVMDSSFFVHYKQTSLLPNEVLVSFLIPFTREVSASPSLTPGIAWRGQDISGWSNGRRLR